MTERSCFFTGHRLLPPEALPAIARRTAEAVDALLARGITRFLAGGAMGFDTLAAELVLARREAGASLTLVLPCRDQARFWPPEARARWHDLRDRAGEVLVLAERYDPAVMRRRNAYLAEHAAVGVYYLTAAQGGTAQTVEYARRLGRELIPVAEDAQLRWFG